MIEGFLLGIMLVCMVGGMTISIGLIYLAVTKRLRNEPPKGYSTPLNNDLKEMFKTRKER